MYVVVVVCIHSLPLLPLKEVDGDLYLPDRPSVRLFACVVVVVIVAVCVLRVSDCVVLCIPSLATKQPFGFVVLQSSYNSRRLIFKLTFYYYSCMIYFLLLFLSRLLYTAATAKYTDYSLVYRLIFCTPAATSAAAATAALVVTELYKTVLKKRCLVSSHPSHRTFSFYSVPFRSVFLAKQFFPGTARHRAATFPCTNTTSNTRCCCSAIHMLTTNEYEEKETLVRLMFICRCCCLEGPTRNSQLVTSSSSFFIFKWLVDGGGEGKSLVNDRR